MPIDTNVQVFTDAELLLLYRQCLAKIAIGQNYQLNGRMMTYADLKEVREMIEWLEERVVVAEDNNGGLGLVQYGERQ